MSEGFCSDTHEQGAPEYKKERVKWLAFDEAKEVRAVLTAEILWDWIYIDEVWVSSMARGEGLGRQLMQLAEEFYKKLGFSQFTRFENFPTGYSRIGFRKTLG